MLYQVDRCLNGNPPFAKLKNEIAHESSGGHPANHQPCYCGLPIANQTDKPATGQRAA